MTYGRAPESPVGIATPGATTSSGCPALLDACFALCYSKITVPTRLRHVYFDDDGTIHPMSQVRFDRVFAPHTREPVPELAGRRVRFLTLYVWFEDGLPLEVSRAEGSLVTFDDEGRRDLADADRERRAAVGLLDQSHRPSTSGVIPAAARFESAGFRWNPSRADIEAAIAVHRLRGNAN